MEILGYVSAVFMGFSLGLIGGGGSILTVPILVYFFHQDGLTATTGSLFVVGVTALIGAFQNARKNMVNFRIGFLFALPSFAGVFFSRKILIPKIPDQFLLPGDLVLTKPLLILFSFAVLMIFASRAMIKSGKDRAQTDKSTHGFLNVASKGFLVGCVTGFVGAGGGFLIIPALVLLLNLPMRMAVGTSLAIIAANSIFGFMISATDTLINWTLLLTLTGLGIAGLFMGYYAAPRFSENKLKQGFGYFVLIIGCLVLIDQVFKLA